jgi:putative heme transporter
LWVVFLPLVIAILLARILLPVVRRLRGAGWRPALAATVVLLGFLVVLGGTLALLGAAVGSEARDLGPTVTRAVDDVERWLVDDAPFDISREDLDQFRTDLRDTIGRTVRSSAGTLVSGAVVAVELLVSLVVGLVVTFFALKDGDRLMGWAERQLPSRHRPLAVRLARRAWQALGGYLRGAALLGVVEGVVIGTTVALVGGSLAVPVAVFTFLAAFVPFAGAIAAGVLAVLVVLATAGPTGAFVVLAVVIVVQQLDNDLLAPLIYGRALQLHPVMVLLAIAAGGALFGLAGTFLAVPVTAVAVNVIAEARAAAGEGAPERPTADAGAAPPAPPAP